MTDNPKPLHGAFVDFDTLDLGDVDARALNGALDTVSYRAQTRPHELAAAVQNADVIMTNKVRLEADTIAALEHTRLICIAATGSNNVDIDAARRHGIAVTNVRGYCTHSLVQHVFGLVLSLTMHLGEYRARIAEGAWQHSDHFNVLAFPVTELAGKTFGIIGYGTLGQAVARVAEAFGMKVCVAERAGQRPRPGRVALERVISESDVLSLHCPLTADTEHLIGAAQLKQMKSHALLINTARGGVVDSAALMAALEAGEIGGAGVDVLAQEPPPLDEPLLQTTRSNLIVTPHIAWAAREARQRVLDELAANIDAFKRGERRNRLD